MRAGEAGTAEDWAANFLRSRSHSVGGASSSLSLLSNEMGAARPSGPRKTLAVGSTSSSLSSEPRDMAAFQPPAGLASPRPCRKRK